MCQGIINNIITIKIFKIFLMYYMKILKLINIFLSNKLMLFN